MTSSTNSSDSFGKRRIVESAGVGGVDCEDCCPDQEIIGIFEDKIVTPFFPSKRRKVVICKNNSVNGSTAFIPISPDKNSVYLQSDVNKTKSFSGLKTYNSGKMSSSISDEGQRNDDSVSFNKANGRYCIPGIFFDIDDYVKLQKGQTNGRFCVPYISFVYSPRHKELDYLHGNFGEFRICRSASVDAA